MALTMNAFLKRNTIAIPVKKILVVGHWLTQFYSMIGKNQQHGNEKKHNLVLNSNYQTFKFVNYN